MTDIEKAREMFSKPQADPDEKVDRIMELLTPPHKKADPELVRNAAWVEVYTGGVKAGTLRGNRIAITGTLAAKRAIVMKAIESAGGDFHKRVTPETTVLITGKLKTGQVTTNKMEKAREYGVMMVGEDEFIRKLQGK